MGTALMLFCAGSACATTYTFTEKGPPTNTDNWSEALSWDPTSGPPGPGDTAIIGSSTYGYSVNVLGAVTVANLTLINSQLQAGGSLTVTGAFESQSANLAPSGGITIGGTLTVDPMTPSAGGTGLYCPLTVSGSGSVTVNSNAAILFGAGVALVNNGSFTLADGGALGSAVPSGATFINNGQFTGGNAACNFGASVFTNAVTGTVTVNSGATLQFEGDVANSGNFQAGAGGAINVTSGMAAHNGAKFTGTGTTFLLGGEHTLEGTVTVPGNLQLGGASAGSPTLTLNGTLEIPSLGYFDWQGGALTGVGTNLTGTIQTDGYGLMAINGLNTLTLRNCIVTNNGALLWTNSGTVYMGYNAQIVNIGGCDVGGDAELLPLPDGSPGYSLASFLNVGRVEKENGAADSSTEIDVPFYGGTVQVDQGNLLFEAGGSIGTWYTAPGASIQMTGGDYTITSSQGTLDSMGAMGGTVAMKPGVTLNIASNQTLSVSGGNFTQSGGTIYGNGELYISGLHEGVFNWTGGTITITNSAGVRVASRSGGAGGVMNIAGAGNFKTIKYGGILNYGTINWTNDNSAGGVNAGDNVVLDNFGGFNIQCDAPLSDVSLTNHPVFTNELGGVIAKSAYMGTTSIGIKTVNLGQVQPLSGTIDFYQFEDREGGIADAFTLEGGNVTFDTPTTVYGTIQGSGKITVSQGMTLDGNLDADIVPVYGDLTNNGTMESGFAAETAAPSVRSSAAGNETRAKPILGAKANPAGSGHPIAEDATGVTSDTPGTITFHNNYTQTTNGLLVIPILGTNAAMMEFGQIIVPFYGEVYLAGTLEVEIANGYAPPVGATFPFLTSYQRNGTFNNVILPQGFTLNYTPGGATLVVTNTVPVEILSPALTGGQLQFGFNTVAGRSYTLQYNNDLSSGAWMFLTNFTGTGSAWQFTAPSPPPASQFYRVSNP
ncbi:MAG: hypothetical protein ABSA47_12680 [Verrucomicrobiota bacterium]